jgi:hypothetical protein
MKTIKSIRNLEEKVRYCLERSERARNSDVFLTQMIIWEYLRPETLKGEDGRIYFSADSGYIVREDNVKRIRARLQNEKNLYLPTEEKIRKARRINEEEWRRYLGLNPEMRTA